MENERFKIAISESVGEVSAEAIMPDNARWVMVLAHGAGAGMDHRFMKNLSEGLAQEGIGTVRFNFGYMEKKKGRPDPQPVAEKTIARVFEEVTKKYKGMRFIAAGKSFGGRMTSNLLSKGNDYAIEAMIFFGFPLHPAGKPDTVRAAHLKSVSVPMLFLQGTRDALAEISLIKSVTGELSLASLVLFEGADHSFSVGKKEIVPELIAATKRWLEKTAG